MGKTRGKWPGRPHGPNPRAPLCTADGGAANGRHICVTKTVTHKSGVTEAFVTRGVYFFFFYPAVCLCEGFFSFRDFLNRRRCEAGHNDGLESHPRFVSRPLTFDNSRLIFPLARCTLAMSIEPDSNANGGNSVSFLC